MLKNYFKLEEHFKLSRVAYVNGNYLNETEAKVSIFDRGFLFADAVYEVTAVIDGKIIEWEGHIKRLKRSLNELDMKLSLIHI